MITFDHAVIFVTDLRQAADDYAALGFQVVPGGVHVGGLTHNALIPFTDGTYLELLAPTSKWRLTQLRLLGATRLGSAFTRGLPILRRTIKRIRSGEGLVDFALGCSPLSDILKVADMIDGMEGPIPGGRVRPDGQRIAWQLAVPRVPALPFMIEDLTPRHLRVPQDVAHHNGATGVQMVSVVTVAFARTVARYQALLGREPFETVAPIPHSRAGEFRIDNAVVRLLAPTGTDHPLRAQLDRGEGIHGLVLRADKAVNLDPVRAHGAQITLARG
ncbi:MAG TPA: VOC family protein [bacterium]|nr:VOC family protein [bacterium]